MSQKVSVAAGNSIYTQFDTLIPSIGDTADIVEAFRLYHYGKAGFTTGGAPADDSIHSHLQSLRDDISELQDSPGSGQISDEVPHDLDAGAVKVEVPNGYLWVDGDSVGSFDIGQGTVAFSNNEPAVYSHGLIWVDKDAPQTDPFNLDNFLTQAAVDLVYLSKTDASATYMTRALGATKNIEVVDVDSTTYPVTAGEIYGLLVVDGSANTSIVVPDDDSINFDVGASFAVLRTGSADVTISPGSGVSLVGTPGTRLRTQYSFATCVKIAANSWVVIGDTAVA
jgi:hypothetical protein